MKFDDPDVMSWLLEASKDSDEPATSQRWLMGDSRLIVIAGR